MTDMDAIRARVEESRIAQQLLLDALEIPEYTNRQLQADRVKSIVDRTINGKSGWSTLAPQEVVDLLEVGDAYILEVRGFSLVTGWIVKGKWYGRKSDQDLNRERDELLSQMKAEGQEQLKKNREEWTIREKALPEWLQDQIQAARKKDPEFETRPMGWRYALVSCELAVLYFNIGEKLLEMDYWTSDMDSEEINEFAEKHGTSGNQHQFAISAAKSRLIELKKADRKNN